MAAVAPTKQRQIRKWKTVTKSTFVDGIPYTTQYLQVRNRDIECECLSTCDCQWDGSYDVSCPCLIDNQECKNCGACESILSKGEADNQQISRLGLNPKKTNFRWLNDKMGYSLVMEEDWTAGEALIGWAGHVTLEGDVPKDHKVYVVGMGDWEFELKKDHGQYKKGTIFKGKWAMDCTDIGTDANLINSTCGHNNVTTLIVMVVGLPIPVAFGKKAGKAGL